MDKWEYTFAYTKGAEKEILSEINKLGQQGWELAGVGEYGRGIFKRKIPSSPTQQIQSQRSPRREDDFDISF